MSEMKPLRREELYLNRLAGVEEQPLPDKPLTREEQYYDRLCGGANEIPEKPLTRNELFLAKLNGEEVVTPEPHNRIEQYMAFATGETKDKPENPLTREEWYWDNYQGGAVPEEKTVSGTLIHVTDAIEEPATKLAVTMTPSQEATPFVGETTTEPYLSKTASTTGNKRYLDKIVGGTVAWNQLITNGDFADDSTTGWVGWNETGSPQNHVLTASNGVLTLSSSQSSNRVWGVKTNVSLNQNHKYLLLGKYARLYPGTDPDMNTIVVKISDATNSQTIATLNASSINTVKSMNKCFIASINANKIFWNVGGYVNPYGAQNLFSLSNVMIIDLTQLFSNQPAIADYIYSLEQATAGAGVQWLKDHGFIDDNYREYNPGELISAKPTAFTVGGDTYTLGGVDLRGLFKLDSNNKLYCDGDIYPPSGEISERYGIVDLGSFDWKYKSNFTNPNMQSDITISDAKAPALNSGIANIICGIVATTTATDLRYTPGVSGVALTSDKYIRIAYANMPTAPATFKTAMNGVYLVYELATPTTSTSTPYTNPAPIANGDMEAFIDSRAVPIPVGNESHYAGEYEIEGHESVTVYQAQAQDEPNPTEYEVEFTEQGTVYGGIIDIVTGVLTITWGYIASYNGETLTGEWLSDRDVYSAGATPTTGAEVAYELATPITEQLTPQEVQMLLGENYFWAENGESMELTYKARAAQRVLAMNRKLNLNKQALEIKRNGGVIIDKPIIKPIDKGGLKL